MNDQEHFRLAVRLLVGPGPVKQRLGDAYLRHLQHVEVRDLPREFQADFALLCQSMHSERAVGGLGAVEATVRKMSELDASRLAVQMLDLYVALAGGDAREPASPAPARQLRLVGDDDEIPPFLSRA